MLRKIALMVILATLAFTACSNSNLLDFDKITKTSNFSLFHMFDDYPALNAMWDSIDGVTVNDKLGDTIRSNEPEFLTAAQGLIDLVDANNETAIKDKPLPSLLRDLGFLLGIMIDTDPRYNTTSGIGSFYNDGETTTIAHYQGLIRFLNNATKDGDESVPPIGDSLLVLLDKVITYVAKEDVTDHTTDTDDPFHTDDPANPFPGDYSELYTSMSETMETFAGLGRTDARDDYIDVMEVLSKALIRCDYPKYADSATNGSIVTDYAEMNTDDSISTGTGNLVKGVHAILSGMLKSKEYAPADGFDPIDRQKMYDTLMMIRDNVLRKTSGATPTYNNEVFKALIQNLESYFTVGGAIYDDTTNHPEYNSVNGFNSADTGDWGDQYSDTELRNTLKEVLAQHVGVFMRGDRDGSVLSDGSKDTIADKLAKANIGIDWENSKIDESLYDLVRYDVWGRDRTDPASNAYPSSFIESFLFLSSITNNFGYVHGGETQEFTSSLQNTYNGQACYHGHGAYMGTISLNDSLQSITGKQDGIVIDWLSLEVTTGGYELAIDDTTNVKHRDHIFRCKNSFTFDNRNNYRFNYDFNYPAIAFSSGPSAMDIGVSDGGNPNGDLPYDADDRNEGLNMYRPYYSTGQGTTTPASWTMSSMARVSWEGEGPYYYLPSDAPTTDEFGRNWEIAFAPNGEIYAYVDRSVTPYEYYYPTRNDAEENDSTWCVLDMEDAVVPVEYISKEDLRDGLDVPVSIWFNSRDLDITLDGHTFTASFPRDPLELTTKTYTYEQVVSIINDAAGYTVCYAHEGGTLRFVSYDGNISIDNGEGYALTKILGEDNDTDPVGASFTSPLSANGTLQVTIDGTDHDINFLTANGPWTPTNIFNHLHSSLGSNVERIGLLKFLIRGQGINYETDGITVDNNTDIYSGDVMLELFGSSSGINVKPKGRKNRYMDTWLTDYYMITNYGEDKAYVPNNLSSLATDASCFIFEESIKEDDAYRNCASQEEAIYRNYQFFATEKKMVLVIPLWLRDAVGGMFPIESAAFQIVEGNGWSGINNCRKFRASGVWAKANHSEKVSTVPGDYRMTINAGVITSIALMAKSINTDMFYNQTLGRGTANPAIIGMNIAALYRFGFPRQDALTIKGTSGSDMYFQQDQLGSMDTNNPEYNTYRSGFSVGDAEWNKRNTLLPLIVAFFGALHQYSNADNHGLTKAIDGLTPLIKPLTYYNNSINDNLCEKGWLPRIQGDADDLIYTRGANTTHTDFVASDSFIDGFEPYGPEDAEYSDTYTATDNATAWFGGWNVRNYYQPKPLPTLMSFLIDSNSNINRTAGLAVDAGVITNRCDGLLPLISKYDTSAERSATNKSATNLLSKGINALAEFGDDGTNGTTNYNDPDGIDYTASNFDETTYSQWGPRRKIFYGMEQLVTGMKLAKGPYCNINMNNDVKRGFNFAGDGKYVDTYLPNWIFGGRSDDLDMDDMLDKMIGPDQALDPTDEPCGLAAFPDNGQLKENEVLKHYNRYTEAADDDQYLTENFVDDVLKMVPVNTGYTSVPSLNIYAFKLGVNGNERFQINSGTDGADISTIVTGVTDAIPSDITLAEDTEDLDDDGKTAEVRVSFVIDNALKSYAITCDYEFNRDDNWEGLAESMDDIDDMFADFIADPNMDDSIAAGEGEYSIYTPLMDVLDSVLSKNTTGTFDDAQVKGLLYSIGKLLANYNESDGTWATEGEAGLGTDVAYDDSSVDQEAKELNKIYRILAYSLPKVNPYMADELGVNENFYDENKDYGPEVLGQRYFALLKVLHYAMKYEDTDNVMDEGMMQFLFDTVNTGDYGWGRGVAYHDVTLDYGVIDDLARFLTSDTIWSEDTDMYGDLSGLVTEMSKAINYTTNETLREALSKYGFENYKY